MINLTKEDFQENLSTLTLPNGDFYEKVSQKYLNHNGGVYILRTFNNDDSPNTIPRSLGNDSSGILYIGKASKFTHRTGDLARAFDDSYQQAKHDCAIRYNGNKKWNETYPKNNLRLSFFISENPEELESKFISDYVTEFGEVPPLNSQG